MRKLTLIGFAFLISFQLYSQQDIDSKRKLYFPIWTYHSENVDVLGLSVGGIPEGLKESFGTSRTYGTRLEIDPFSILYFMFGNTAISANLEAHKQYLNNGSVSQQVYGFNISTGTLENIDLYGISISAFMQSSRKSNGISITGVVNQIESANGILIAGGGNQSFVSNGLTLSVFNNETHFLKGIQIAAQNHVIEGGRGIQIGISNTAKNFRGIQIGLWNKNDKRSFPLINWQFKS